MSVLHIEYIIEEAIPGQALSEVLLCLFIVGKVVPLVEGLQGPALIGILREHLLNGVEGNCIRDELDHG